MYCKTSSIFQSSSLELCCLQYSAKTVQNGRREFSFSLLCGGPRCTIPSEQQPASPRDPTGKRNTSRSYWRRLRNAWDGDNARCSESKVCGAMWCAVSTLMCRDFSWCHRICVSAWEFLDLLGNSYGILCSSVVVQPPRSRPKVRGVVGAHVVNRGKHKISSGRRCLDLHVVFVAGFTKVGGKTDINDQSSKRRRRRFRELVPELRNILK